MPIYFIGNEERNPKMTNKGIQQRPQGDIQPTQEERELILELKKKELALKEREIRIQEEKNRRGKQSVLWIVIAALSVIACLSIILVGTLLFKKSSPPLSSPIVNQPINTALAVIEPTQVLIPTEKTLPTDTGLPSLTSVEDTSPGTILDVGQTWRQEELELSLSKAEMGEAWVTWADTNLPTENGIYVTMKLKSQKLQDISINYNLYDSVSAVDNFGRNLSIYVAGADVTYDFRIVNQILKSHETITLRSWNDSSSGSVFVSVDTASTDITEIKVIVSLLGITNATWRIPIYH